MSTVEYPYLDIKLYVIVDIHAILIDTAENIRYWIFTVNSRLTKPS